MHFIGQHKKLRSIENSCQSINLYGIFRLTFRLCYYRLCAFCPHICKHNVKYTVTTDCQCIHEHCTISLMAGIQFVLRTKNRWKSTGCDKELWCRNEAQHPHPCSWAAVGHIVSNFFNMRELKLIIFRKLHTVHQNCSVYWSLHHIPKQFFREWLYWMNQW